MDDKTRGVGHDEFTGRGEDSTRNYAAGPTPRSTAQPTAGTSPRTTSRPTGDELDPETERRTRQIEGEIEHTRAELSETVDALQEKLRPANLVSDATDRVKNATSEKVRDMADTASETAQGMWEGARQNPVPALMIGAGVAWMLLDRSRHGNGHSSRRAWSGYSSPRRYGAVNDPDDYYRDDARGESRAWSGQHSERSSGEGLTTWAREAGGEARHTARRAQNGLQRMLRQNPLLVGAAAMLAGAAVGASLPETERENELMGEARDSVVDRAQNAAENAVSAVKEATNEVVGDTVGKVAEKVTAKKS